MRGIELHADTHRAADGSVCQQVHIKLTAADRIAQPGDLVGLELPESITGELPVVIEGKGSNWMYAYLAWRLTEKNPPWIGCYDPTLKGAVVIESRQEEVGAGRVVWLEEPQTIPDYRGQIGLRAVEEEARGGERFQCLEIELRARIAPGEISGLKMPQELDLSRGVVLFGPAPVWLFAHLALRCRSAPWVGCYNIQNGSFIITGAAPGGDRSVGNLYYLVNRAQCPAVLVGGPPESGKSVFCAAADQELSKEIGAGVHLQRAQVDGEGDWYMRMGDRVLAAELRRRAKGSYTERFFFYQASAVASARETVQLVLVDFGGAIKNEDLPLLHRCSHYIIVTREAGLAKEWHEFCRERGGLRCLAEIRSMRGAATRVLQEKPHLVVEADLGSRENPRAPEPVLDLLRRLCQSFG